jgi:hypothetical protein
MSIVNKKKCSHCFKKTIFYNLCKCEKDYCFDCTPYFNHNCSYDWRKERKEDLIKQNPQINPLKVEQI